MLESALQKLQGTPWQDRMLFLQENTDTYRLVSVFLIIGLYVISSVAILLICRKSFKMSVCALCFVPIVNVILIPWGIICRVFSMIGSAVSGKGSKPKKVKSAKGSNDDLDIFDMSEDGDIDLF